MKKLMFLFGLFLALFSASGQSIRDYSTKDIKDYNIFIRPLKSDLKLPIVPGQTSTPKQFLGSISLDTVFKSIDDKVKLNPTFLGTATISKGSQAIGSTTPSGGFILQNPSVSYTSIEMGVGSGFYGSWIQARNPTANTSQYLTLNPTGGNVGIGITNGTKTLSVNGSIGFGGLAAKDLQTELDLKATKSNPAFTGNSVFTGNVSISNIFTANSVNGATINADVLQADQSNANILQVQDAFQYSHTTKGEGKFLTDQDGQGNAFWSLVPISSVSGLQTSLNSLNSNVATNTSNISANTTAISTKLTFLVSASFAAIPAQSGVDYKIILVLSDEKNGNSPTMYFYDGTNLQWLPTLTF